MVLETHHDHMDGGWVGTLTIGRLTARWIHVDRSGPKSIPYVRSTPVGGED